jgi:hypothetical protein
MQVISAGAAAEDRPQFLDEPSRLWPVPDERSDEAGRLAESELLLTSIN